MESSREGIFLVCDLEGRILKINHNDIDAKLNKAEDRMFADLFNADSISGILEFLIEIKKNKVSFGSEFTLKPEYNYERLNFSGVIVEDTITIFGSRTKLDFQKFVTELMLINNDQINKIRELEKFKSARQNNINVDNYYMEELSRLNNELVDLQREMSKKNVELANLNKIKNQFIGMAAHDLRNPLGVIINYCEFLENDFGKLNKDQAEFISQIKSSSAFMLNLVTDLLDVSSIESGSITLKLEKHDLTALVENIVQSNKYMAGKKNIILKISRDEQPIIFVFDKSKIHQLITNLITNAIKFSYPGSEVCVEVFIKNGEAEINVKDNGQGIQQEDLKLLFKPFQKTSVKATAGEKSSGLGLYIVKRITDAHSGRIDVDSVFGKGSTFSVKLPMNLSI
jgi:signal transduction histidine kinase